ncbi:MAG TPA: hypothetical protein PKE23_06285, partial [Anaerolineales bacterium]|nr:hypothetical protein [Anaerolineales bacterium]
SKVKVETEVEVPVAESLQDPAQSPAWLDRWAPWIYGALALIVIVYGPVLFEMIKNISLNAPGYRVW